MSPRFNWGAPGLRIDPLVSQESMTDSSGASNAMTKLRGETSVRRTRAGRRYVAVRGLPPVKTATDAVRVAIAAGQQP